MTSGAVRRLKTGVLAVRDFRLFLVVRFLVAIAWPGQLVAIGWELYNRTNRLSSLGFLGLCAFVPGLVLLLFSGAVADRFDRRRLSTVFYACFAALSVLLYVQSLYPTADVWPIYACVVGLAAVRAFVRPAIGALARELIPADQFGRAVALAQVTFEVGAALGAAAGGWIYGLSGRPGVVYLTSAMFGAVAALLLIAMEVRPARINKTRMSLETLLAGVVYVWRTKVVLGLISLDLFAGFFGGSVALMPAFARDVLHVGPLGLGLLRGAPSVGAVAVAIVLAFRPIGRRAGSIMLWSVAVFAVATIAFGLATHLVLALAALVVVGASDMVSVVIRQTLLQVATPDAVRGRVMAVNELAVNTSNELGELESGFTAAWFGLVPAIVVGGIASLGVVIVHAIGVPMLRHERIGEVAPEPVPQQDPKLEAAS
jgi:MFS family permease